MDLEDGEAMAGGGEKLVMKLDLGDQEDTESLDDATRNLRRELEQLNVKRVDATPAAPAPPLAKGPNAAAIGTLILTLGQAPQLEAVLAAVLDWVSRGGRRSARVELDGDVLEVTGLSARDQRRIIDDWLGRHRGR